MKNTVSTLVAAALLVSQGIAQPQFRRPDQALQGLYYAAVNLLSADSSRTRIDIHYRIDENFFVAVRNPDTTFPHEFRRRGEVSVELVDSSVGSVARELENVLIGSESAENALGPKRWHQGIFSLDVRPGTYRIVIEVNDLESKRSVVERSRTLSAYAPHGQPLAVSTPLFLARPDTARVPQRLVPQNFGDELLFGTPTALLLEVASTKSPDDPVTVRYRITSQASSSSEPPEVTIEDSVTLTPVLGYGLVPQRHQEGIAYALAGGQPDAPRLVVLPFPGERLILRTYLLTLVVRQGDAKTEITREFRAVWPDMPMSLKDVDYALDAMRYITTEDELDSLKSGNYDARRRHFEEYWKLRDRTPETAFNEVMTEYYRRVDHASRAFGTLRNPDGAKSDRGRIFILHGPPTRTERTLNPGGLFEEVWFYERLKKRFTFVDRSKNGNYELLPGATG